VLATYLLEDAGGDVLDALVSETPRM